MLTEDGRRGTIYGRDATMERTADMERIWILQGHDLETDCTEQVHNFAQGVQCKCGRYSIDYRDSGWYLRNTAEGYGPLAELGMALAVIGTAFYSKLGCLLVVAFPVLVAIMWIIWRWLG